mmetsp:Transcript_23469/g.52737  ORF Transcript_23469/g.52737 Transcript_23469/m.52737 type:complete len:1166 (+) Transcript_23469:139-3636(+)
MATFQKPENALKRAEELIAVGKKQDALDTLHAAMQNRKFRNLWTTTIERIMVRHLELCVELKKMRTAREGLYQYRTMCQAANIGSLELVVQRFRKAAEEKVSEAKKLKDSQADLADLDEMEAPQTILLRAIQAQDTRQQSQDRDTHAHFRFLWDTYKVVLDVLKSNVRLEEVYHETARHAFDFCRANQRPQEFKRLCETLRKNYQELHKHTGKVPVHQVNPNQPDTIMRTLETRCRQLQISTELDLWRESYLTATEIFELMSKARPKPHLRSMYYEYLGQIFWKSDNHLFHAFACLKNLMFVKAAKQNLSKEELHLLASKAVLATLCVPFQKNSDMHATLELTTEGASSPYEKAKKHATLFNVQSVPTRDSISAQLVEKGLLALSEEPVKRLFALIESDFTPLSLCQDAKPFLDEIAKDTVCEGKLVNYITPLKQIIFFRLMKQLSEVYANMTIENFERAASIVPFSIAEKWMANAARQHGINIQINYSHKAIVFGAPRKVDMKSMRQPLIEIGYKLQQAMQRVAPEEQHKKEKLEKAQLSQNIVKRIEEETKLIRQRKEEIERRKEESEKRKEIQDREAMEKLKKQEAKEAEAERARQEEERKRREIEREEQSKRQAQMARNKEMLEQMKKETSDKVKIKVAGKTITQIDAEDLENIGFDQIEKARGAQVQRERQEKIRQRKLESKRVDHLARALREEEQECLAQWADDIAEQDNNFLNIAEEKNAEEQYKKHEEGLKEKEMLLPHKESKDEWCETKLEVRMEEYREMMEAREYRLMKQVVQNKIERARERMKNAEEDRKARAAEARKRREREEAEERRRQEEEEEQRRKEEEEEERRRQEEEEEERRAEEAAEKERRKEQLAKERKERAEMAERAEAKRREREREIEERQQNQSRGGGRDDRAPARGGDDRDWGRGGGRDAPKKDEEDNWRRGPAPRGGDREERPRGGGRDGGEWRRGGDDREEPRAPARGGRDGEGDWRRGGEDRAPARGGDKEESGGAAAGPWRRPAREEPAKEEAGPWRRGGGDRGGGDRGGDAPPSRTPKADEGGAWRRDGPPKSSAAAAPEPEAPPPRKAAPPPAEEKPAEEDGEEWGTVVKGKKGKKPKEAAPADEEGWSTAGGGRRGAGAPKEESGWRGSAGAGGAAGNAGDRRPTPPWKRTKTPK